MLHPEFIYSDASVTSVEPQVSEAIKLRIREEIGEIVPAVYSDFSFDVNHVCQITSPLRQLRGLRI